MFLNSAEDRRVSGVIRKNAARKTLLTLLLETNHDCVHPLNVNYEPDGSHPDRLVAWADYNGLLSLSDKAVLRGF